MDEGDHALPHPDAAGVGVGGVWLAFGQLAARDSAARAGPLLLASTGLHL